MSNFNLIDEAWMPVRWLDGGYAELGIRETLLRGKEIAAIEDPSPLVVAALHRFLLAVLYRALDGPTNLEEAKSLFHHGLPGDKLSAYLERWRERFWLFHDKWPFGQIPDFTPKEWRAWTALAAEFNADNAKVLFDHVNVQTPGEITPASAAKWLLATLTFSVSCGKSELSHTKTAPSATSVMVIPIGKNLQDTLLYSLVPENRSVLTEDIPLWERGLETTDFMRTGPSRQILGIADRYTWRTRSIRLVREPSGGVARLAFASGMDFDPGDDRDPMLGYREDAAKGLLPLQFRERGLWRDFDSLLPDDPVAPKLAPRVIQHAVLLTQKERQRFPRLTLAIGQANDKAKIEFWRMERFELPYSLAGTEDIRKEIRSLLDHAENAQKSLYQACTRYARNLVSRASRIPDKADIQAFMGQIVAIPLYWSVLERKFHELLHAYDVDKSATAITLQWKEAIREALGMAWGKHLASVAGGDAWAIRALVRAEGPIIRELHALGEEITQLKLDLQKEEA